ncbi:hypothetical protein EAH79_03955 [Sphingomonas koreensis]|nr:hypothetical protein EAH87_03240 [Sphingomonas koreensis]TPG42987.1 hypothetical protein EAH79_03955 [Sphingomonas koreensis]
MAALGFVVFAGAFVITLAVLIGTLIPALPRIAEALAGLVEPAPAPRLVLARSRTAITQRPQPRPLPYREAA